MRKVKLIIFTKVFIMIIVSFLIISVVFELAVNKYVDKKAVQQIKSKIASIKRDYDDVYNLLTSDGYIFELFNQSEEDTDYNTYGKSEDILVNYFIENYNYEQMDIVPINRIIVDKHYNLYTSNDYGNGEDIKDIIRYYSDKRFILEEGKCNKIRINNRDYYTAGTKIILGYTKDENSVLNTQYEPEDGMIILVADINPVLRFVKWIDRIFLIIMMAAGFILCLVGYKIGSNIENDQKKLTYLFQNVSHELKTPIMSIEGYAEGIETNVIKDHVHAAGIILGESEKMRGLVEEILFISKLDSGKVKKGTDEINICELLYYCMGRVEQEALKKHINLEADFAENIPMYKGNEVQLEKVFLNLLSNGLRYAKTKIRICCTHEKKYIKIIVADDGNGIDEKDFPHLFERFYKGKNGVTGIGLSIAKEVVKIHKGSIEAKNDNGANFIVKLKL
ncbi:MAG: HAMP domain-containing histidine kinase [Lachnospiraceae bacterium]|nr:HAMP domain-containing histidine kinase [Lachnospiraceae bacterium]